MFPPLLRFARPPKRRIAVFALVVLGALLALGLACSQRGGVSSVPPGDIGLFTSLPIVWSEYGELSELLQPEGESHWAVAVLKERGALRPLDRIAPLPGNLELLVMAQPRPLSPDENVALDQWVRGGGRVLLFADPMLTQHSQFAIGDRRRPEGTVLLSPILTRWGLTLQFDEAQPAGGYEVELFGQLVRVSLAGRFMPAEGASQCQLYAEGLAVRCAIGTGAVMAIADAALLEPASGGDATSRAAALNAMLDGAFAN